MIDIDAIEALAKKAAAAHYVCDDCPCVGDCDCHAAPEVMFRLHVPNLCVRVRKQEMMNRVLAEVIDARIRELEAALRAAARNAESAADVIEALDGDMDDECAGVREDVATWLALAGEP